MPRGGKGAKTAAEPSRARERIRSAERETDKHRQADAPEASGTRRSARLLATKSAPHPKEKGQLSPQRSRQQAQGPKTSTRSRPGAITVLDSEGDTALVRPPAKKGRSTAPESRKSREISRSSKPKTVTKDQRKATAKPNRLSKQDSTSQFHPPRKGAKREKAKQSGPVVGKPTQKSAKGKRKAKSADPAPGSSPDLVPGDESGRRGRREGSESRGHHQALSRKALSELQLKLGSGGAARGEEPTYTSGTTYADPRDEFNHKYGYLPPLDEIASHIIAAIMDKPASAKRWGRIGPEISGLFEEGLGQRNVETDPCESIDPRSDEIKSFGLQHFLRETAEQKEFCEHLWLRDKAKLRPNSSEAFFQKTLMVSLIARHFLIYEKEVNGEQLLDFSVEESWACLPMPSRALCDAGPGLDRNEKLLTQPRPDLAVCFNRKAVIKDDLWKSLPKATKELACFENQNAGKSRIFHFLTVEAKNAVTSLEAPKALHQSLNNASQALNNFYEFFQDAGPTHKQIFFDKIRFFSVVADAQGILIRVHRAVEIPQEANRYELVMHDRPEYRLNFKYREWARLTGEDGFTRERVIEVFRKMLRYAVDELSVLISAAANDLMEMLNESSVAHQARMKAGFYRHGQPSPNTSRNTPRTSRATSTSRKSVPPAEQLHKAAQSFTKKTTKRQNKPKANYSFQYSQLSNGSNKRTRSQVDTESTDSEESQVRGKRSQRLRASKAREY